MGVCSKMSRPLDSARERVSLQKSSEGLAGKIARRSLEVLTHLGFKITGNIKRLSEGLDFDPFPTSSNSGGTMDGIPPTRPEGGMPSGTNVSQYRRSRGGTRGLSMGWDPEDVVFEGLVGGKRGQEVHRAWLAGHTVAVRVCLTKRLFTSEMDQCNIFKFGPKVETSHPNLVTLHGIHRIHEGWKKFPEFCKNRRSHSETDGLPNPHCILGNQIWVVMEYCDMGSLQNAILSGSINCGLKYCMSHFSNIMNTGLEIASGMQHLHKLGIVHGDLRAKNIMLQRSDSHRKQFVSKVVSFGKYQGAQTRKVIFPQGALDHRAPEVLIKGDVYYASDVFSFAILLLEMMIETDPYQGMTDTAITMAVLHGMRPAIPSVCPANLAALIKDCWHQDLHRRPTFDSIVFRLIRMIL